MESPVNNKYSFALVLITSFVDNQGAIAYKCFPRRANLRVWAFLPWSRNSASYLLQQYGKIGHEPQDAPVPDGS